MSRASGADPREPDAHHKPSLLGLSMRICEPELSLENVWHVMDVLEGSPAESAGLVPYGDWIIGWSEGALSAEGDFYDVVESVSIGHNGHIHSKAELLATSILINHCAFLSILTTSSTSCSTL